jgi:hypothetical protein
MKWYNFKIHNNPKSYIDPETGSGLTSEGLLVTDGKNIYYAELEYKNIFIHTTTKTCPEPEEEDLTHFCYLSDIDIPKEEK